jgi:phage recombination protein Bet
MTTALQTLTSKLAARFNMGDGSGVTEILKNTAFKGKEGVTVSDSQMSALLVIANQYGLNPFTKEIYAYPDKQNGIVPVVGVDGWTRIINERPELDGIEFRYSEETITHKGKKAHEWIDCIITRKDRAQPVVIREYFDEVVRTLNFPTPWDTHPKRMHRHKALIQCARIAFGFAGIYDQDEAERIIEINPAASSAPASGTVIEGSSRPALEAWPQDKLDKQIAKWRESGTKTADEFIALLETRGALSDEQKAAIRKPVSPDGDFSDEEIAAIRARELAEANQ